MGVTYRYTGLSHSLKDDKERPFLLIYNMKKNVYLVCLSLLLMACSNDKGEAFFSQWEGEYVRTESFEGVYADGNTEVIDNSSREQPFYIFEDNGLYVQTYGIGDPFIPNEDPEEHLIYVRSPKRVTLADDSIEVVELVDTMAYIIMINGGVYTICNGHVISPKPVEVRNATTDKLIFSNSKEFEVEITNADGTNAYTAICHWEYSPLQKQNEIYTWKAELHIAIKDMPGLLLIPAIYRHNIVLTRKE